MQDSSRPSTHNLAVKTQIQICGPYEAPMTFFVSEASLVIQNCFTSKIGVVLVCDLLEDSIFGICLLLLSNHAWVKIIFHEFLDAPKLYMLKDEFVCLTICS